MRVILKAILLTAVLTAPGLAEVPHWAEAPEVYEITEDGFVASDGGESTSDKYLLTERDYGDFALSFDLTRLKGDADRLRAIVVWGVDRDDTGNRMGFFLPVDGVARGETAHFEVIVLGGQAVLKRDGEVVSRNPSVYGTPLDVAPVGSLHYYDYYYRYSNLDLQALTPEELPAVQNLRADVSRAGVVTLTWDEPELLAGVLQYEVRRRPVDAEAADWTTHTDTPSATDTSARTAVNYSYSVIPLVNGRRGPIGDSVTVRIENARPPAPPADVTATRRIDGSVRVRWSAAPDSRAAGFQVRRAGAVLAADLPPDSNSFVAPPGDGALSIATLDPDGGASPSVSVSPEPHAPVVDASAQWPERHPRVLYEATELERIRDLARQDEQVRGLVESMARRGDALLEEPIEIPQEKSDGHRVFSGRATTASEAYAVTGDDRYAAWVREVLLGYADLYQRLEPSGTMRTRIMETDSGLYEATWFVPMVVAYDIVYDSPVFSAEDHARIERDLLRPAVELFLIPDYSDTSDWRTRDTHYKCYNFQAWFLSGVGVTGLLLRDPDMVEYAIDSPYGLKHLIEHDVRDDGIFWERSLGYHGFVLSALMPLLQGAYHCNLDLYALEVADDGETLGSSENYTVGDGNNGPKSIRLMFEGPLYALYGDRSYACIGDSNPGPLGFGAPWFPAWERYRDPRLAWLYQQEHSDASSAGWGGPKDLSAQVRLAYDEDALYLSARVTDQVVRNTHQEPAQAWAGDLLWVGLKWREGEGGDYDIIYGLTPGDGEGVPPVPVVFNRFGEVAHEVSAGDYAVSRTEDGYAMELAIPWSELAPREGEDGQVFTAVPGATLTADFVLYDTDQKSGETTKEKMLAWSAKLDRYDSTEGGRVVLGPSAEGEHTVAAPPAEGLTVDGDLSDWDTVGAAPATIGDGSTVMTDAASGPGLRELVWGVPDRDAAEAPDYRSGTFANNGVLEAGCSLYPSTGWAILRECLDETGMPPLDATCATLNYGPHGGGHGHPDQLSIVLYADGKQWLPDFRSCAYGSDAKRQWTSQTISHNTLVVDQISQYPTGDSTPSWPCDSASRQARGFLRGFFCDAGLKAASAGNTAVYDGVTLTRTVAVVGDALLDFYEADADSEHTYDYPLHIDGELARASVELAPQDGPLGDALGYQHITNVRRGTASGTILTDWSDGVRSLRVSTRGAPGDELIVGDGFTNSPDRLMPMSIVRRTAGDTVFASVIQPTPPDATPGDVTWLDTEAGVVALRLALPEGEALVLYNSTGDWVDVEGMRTSARLTARIMAADGTETVHELTDQSGG